MRITRWITGSAVAVLTATTFSLQGQGVSPQCPPGTSSTDNARITQDACQKAIDLFQYMAPQLGVAIAGGNATLGQGGPLGGLGHFLITARANVLRGTVPQVDKVTPSASGAQSSTYTTKDQILGLPQLDAAIGLFRGFPLGVTNVGGVDLLLSGAFLPSVSTGTVNVDVPNGSFKVGIGARVGILQESLVMPGVAVTYLHRQLPTVNISASSNSDTLHVDGLSLKANSWRIVASKTLMLLGLSVGAGQDKYSSDAVARAYVAARTLPLPTPAGTAGPVSLTQDLTRTNIFLDATLNLKVFRFIGEIGQVSGGTIHTYNTFSGTQATDSRVYGSAGLRFGF